MPLEASEELNYRAQEKGTQMRRQMTPANGRNQESRQKEDGVLVRRDKRREYKWKVRSDQQA